MHVSIGTPKIINFPFVPNGKFIILGVPNFGVLQFIVTFPLNHLTERVTANAIQGKYKISSLNSPQKSTLSAALAKQAKYSALMQK